MGTITRYWPYGPHGTVGNNLRGIGDVWLDLNRRGVPVFYKGADGYGPIFELWELEDVYHAGNQACFRLTDKGGINWDVPDWSLSPEQAAKNHVKLTIEFLPPEFDKRTWLELINEPDKDDDSRHPDWGSAEFADWLGKFAQECARLLVPLGYKFAAFGFSSGEPEIPDWETPGMVGYLKMCAADPEHVAIAVHEYSYDSESLEDGEAHYPWLLGRFTLIFELCDRLGLRRPTILVTEFGWTLWDIPSTTKALDQLIWAANEVYGPHPEVIFVAIWHFGSGFEGIANQCQPLIAPMGIVAQTWRMEVEEEVDTTPEETTEQRRWRLTIEEQIAHGLQLAPTALQNAIRDAGLHPVTKEMYLDGEPPMMAAEDWNNRTQPRRVFVWEDGRVKTFVEPDDTPPPPPPGDDFSISTYPVSGVTPYMTQRFGRAVSYGFHEGIDLRVYNSSGMMPNVVSVAPNGVIESIRAYDPGNGYGLYVRVKYEGFEPGVVWKVWYCHLSSIAPTLRAGMAVSEGAVLGVAGSSGNSTGPHLHISVQKIPGGLAGFVITNVVDPKPLIEAFGDTPPPPPPPPDKLDLLPYFQPPGNFGPLYEVRDPSGAQRRFQTQTEGSKFYLAKGTGGKDGKAEWEELAYDSEYIWRGADTSPGSGRFYVQYEPNRYMAKWCPRYMALGQSWAGPGHYVQFFVKSTCAKSSGNSGAHTNTMRFVARHSHMNWLGVQVDDVVELLAGGERFFFAKNIGLVAWESPWNSSYISEMHLPGQRPNSIREPICSFTLP